MSIAMIAAFAAFGATAAPLTKEEYKAGRARIAAQAQAERQKCGSRYGNAADMCVARARGDQRVARAELEAAYKPTPRKNYEAAIARARAAEAIAKEECDEKAREMRKACVGEAKAVFARAKVEAMQAMTTQK
ncbi:MAG: hypothetical protein ABI789_14760 [Usitatibacter sp.]